jgi:hypothetical protein
MKFTVIKYLITAAIIVGVSEAAKSGYRWASLLAALPLVGTLALVWMHIEGVPQNKISSFAIETFWYVLPTIPMFFLFGWLLPRTGFWIALSSSALLTVGLFYGMAQILASRGHPLL